MEQKNDAVAPKKRKRDNLDGPDVLLEETHLEQRVSVAVETPVGWSGVPVKDPVRGGSVDVLVRIEPSEAWGSDDAKVNVSKDCLWTTGTVAAIRQASDGKQQQQLLIHITSRKPE